MKIDKSLENIDLVKLLIYAICFVALCGFLLISLVFPTVQNYKNTNIKLYSQNIINASLKEKFEQSQSKLDTLENTNRELFIRFDTEFNEEDFIEFLEQYFHNVRLKRVESEEKNPYLVYEFNTSANLKQVNSFYEFIDALNAYRNIAKLQTPLEFNAQNDKDVDISFIIKIYSSQTTQK